MSACIRWYEACIRWYEACTLGKGQHLLHSGALMEKEAIPHLFSLLFICSAAPYINKWVARVPCPQLYGTQLPTEKHIFQEMKDWYTRRMTTYQKWVWGWKIWWTLHWWSIRRCESITITSSTPPQYLHQFFLFAPMMLKRTEVSIFMATVANFLFVASEYDAL